MLLVQPCVSRGERVRDYDGTEITVVMPGLNQRRDETLEQLCNSVGASTSGEGIDSP